MNGVVAFVVVLILLSVLRIVIGPSVWDRLLGLNLATAKIIILIVILASVYQSSFLLDIGIAYALLGFVGVVFIATYIQRKGRL